MNRISWSILLFTIVLGFFSSASAQNTKPTLVGIMFDNTGSMRSNFESARKIGQATARIVSQKGPTAIFGFVSSTKVEGQLESGVFLDWGQDEKKIDDSIVGLKVRGGQTPLLDAVKSVVNLIDEKYSAEKGKFAGKLLVLISDGEDRVSETNLDELLKFAKEKNIVIYAIGFPQPPNEKKSKKILTQLTESTGGSVVFPKCKVQLSGGAGIVFTPECELGFDKIAGDLLTLKVKRNPAGF